MGQDTRSRIITAVERDGLAPTAARLGTSRTGLASYLFGSARKGTALVIESNVSALGEGNPRSASTGTNG